MACAYWQQLLVKDQDLAYEQRKDERMSAELDKYWGTQTEISWIKL